MTLLISPVSQLFAGFVQYRLSWLVVTHQLLYSIRQPLCYIGLGPICILSLFLFVQFICICSVGVWQLFI